VLARDRWHLGVIGIVAARLVELHRRPVFLIAHGSTRGRGSGRGVRGYDLHQLLGCAGHTLVGYGGHAMAAGLEIDVERVGEFRQAINAAVEETGASASETRLSIDSELPLPAITPRLLRDLDRLSPFGEGNVDPLFASTHVTVAAPPRPVGAGGGHALLRVTQGGITLSAFVHASPERLAGLDPNSTLHMAYTPRLSHYRGMESIELSIKDFEVAV
jgi:single-stranded-DNA-specific exonuclease